MGVNVLAISGAFLAFLSITTDWSVVERGYDWVGVTPYVWFLLFTYPLAMISPLAGIGQAGILLWVLNHAHDNNAVIEPFNGYVIAWISAAFMVASIVFPIRLYRDGARVDISDRLLTMTFRRVSGSWMSAEHSATLVFSVAFIVIGASYLVFDKGSRALGLVLVALIFTLLMLRTRPQAKTAFSGRQTLSEENRLACLDCGTHNPQNAIQCIRCGKVFSEPRSEESSFETGSGARKGHMAWIIFIGISFLSVMIALWTMLGAFGSSGFSGEEKTRVLVTGSIALVVLIPFALIEYRRAIVPPLSRDIRIVSVTLFALIMSIASLQSAALIHTNVSIVEFIILAGIVLIGPALLYVQTQERGEQSGGQSNRSS